MTWEINDGEHRQAARDCGRTRVREFTLFWPRAIAGARELVAAHVFLFRREAERT
jgi:hypothetical protein